MASRPQAAVQLAAVTTFNLAGSGLNPLVRAAGPLLLLAGRLRRAAAPIDTTALRIRLAADVRTFDKRVLDSGVPADQAEAARYALCATLDEAVLSSPWGANSDWGSQPLLRMFHGEFVGGERFFRLTERMESDPRRYAGLLEVHYQCLSLGYEGMRATDSQGRLVLENIRRRLFERIRALKGEASRPLARRWQGVECERDRRLGAIPWWMNPVPLLEWADDRILHEFRKSALEESRNAANLERRFSDAVAGQAKSRADGRRIRNLPWWLVLGMPGAGKTTVVAQSGLSFAAEPAIGAARACEWWFTNDSVLLDIAGDTGWIEMLQFLKRHRRRIQGALLTYSASDLLVRSDADRDADFQASRQRILELNSALGIFLPVYLLITKMDLVLGFREYFDDLETGDRGQVWGVTFAIDDSRSGRAVNTLPTEFDALVGRLHDGIAQRLGDERDLRKRLDLFEFPQQVAALKPRLMALAGKTSGASGVGPHLFVRGVYFTSVTRTGDPVDAVRGVVDAPPGPADHGPARTFFIERLLREVVLREVGLSR